MKKEEEISDLLIDFLDDLRDYIRESGANLANDDRESSEFVSIFLNKHKEPDIDFYDEWIALWPTAKELSNKGVERIYDNNKFRGKLKSFIKDFYKHTGIRGCKDKKTLIMTATKAYISKVKSGAIDWDYIMSPGNFISHQYKGSSLAMYINSGAEENKKISKVDYRNLIG